MDRVGDLELEQDLDFQRREWKVERIGWVGLLLLILLAAIGLFGHGPISWTSASTEDGSLEVSFERFGRRGGSQELVVAAPASSAVAGSWEVELSQDYVASVSVDSVMPEPESVESVAGGVRYTFSQAEADADLEATFALTPSELWNRSGEIRLSGGEALTVSHFLFP